MQDQLAQMMHDKDKPIKTYTLDALYLFPFDKNIYMPPFPRGVEFPKYDKYFGTPNPQDQFQNSEPCLWNSCITKHISCIYSLEV